jgi:hypothetical protein
MKPLIHPDAETAGKQFDAMITPNPEFNHVGTALNTLPDNAPGTHASPGVMVSDVPTLDTNTEFTAPYN